MIWAKMTRVVRRDVVKAGIEAGMTLEEIARQQRTSAELVETVAKSAGVLVREPADEGAAKPRPSDQVAISPKTGETIAHWTQGELDRCLSMWAEGASGTAIGERLARTRKCVRGIIHRHFVGERKVVAKVRRPPKPRAAIAALNVAPQNSRSSSYGHLTMLERLSRTKESSEKIVELPHHPDEPKSLDLSIYELKDNNCHWPHEGERGYLFCGAPSYNSEVYCKHHCLRAYGEALSRRRG